MPNLRLARLPDRVPVKVSINMLPDLHQALTAYAALYATQYGHEEPLSELIPAMLTAFLESDREFQKERAAGGK